MAKATDGLNERQREAVTSTEGFVRVIAGAGSGKTRALSRRFAYLVGEIGAPPSNILCVTFTNKSANEMRQRIRSLTGDNDTGFICTFHSFCVSVLQEEAHAVQYPENFIVLDNADIDAMLAIIYEERGLTLRHMTFANARDMIEMKKTRYEPDYFEDMIAMPLDALRQKYLNATKPDAIIFYGYLYQEKKCFGLDYNDLIKFTLNIFKTNDEVRAKWQQRLEYIMIDEFQDIDELQYELMRALCGWHGNLFVVGDPDQTIYTWRGAKVRYLLDFDKEFTGTKTVMMMDNYRSTPEITAVANSLIANNVNRIQKSLIPNLPSGPRPVWYHADNAEGEARWIAAEIRKLAEGGARLSQVAVLYRSHFVSRSLEEVFIKENLLYAIYSGVQFFGRAEIKDALSYLRLIAFRDDLSFARIVNRPKRNIGERRMAFLHSCAEREGCSLWDALVRSLDDELFKSTKARAFVALIEKYAESCRSMPVSELVAAVLDESGYEYALRTEGSGERLDNLAELKQSIYEYETTCGEETTLEGYLAHIALFSNADALTDKNAVRLMTIHTAKGLEFPYVFVCSMEEGVFPSKKTATIEAMEEERRLAFVALTRAKKRLYLTDSEGRNLDGSFRYPSRFILGINKNLMDRLREPDECLVNEALDAIAISERYLASCCFGPRFALGDRVRHRVLGVGEITAIDDRLASYVIRFDAILTERRISFKTTLEKA